VRASDDRLDLVRSSVCALADRGTSRRRGPCGTRSSSCCGSPRALSHTWNPAYLTGLAFSVLIASRPLESMSLTGFGISTKYANAPKRPSRHDDDQPGQRVRESLEKFAIARILQVTFAVNADLYILSNGFLKDGSRGRPEADEDTRNPRPVNYTRAQGGYICPGTFLAVGTLLVIRREYQECPPHGRSSPLLSPDTTVPPTRPPSDKLGVDDDRFHPVLPHVKLAGQDRTATRRSSV